MVSHCCVLCVRCPGGSYGNRPGLASVDDCIAVGEGFWAPIGSPQSIPCPATGFYCPGKVLDTKYGGARPIIIPVGQSTVIEEAELVNKEMTLDISLDEYDEEALRKSLATLYSVPAELIELSAPTVQTRRSRSLQAYSVQSRSGVAMHTPRALQSASGLQIINHHHLCASIHAVCTRQQYFAHQHHGCHRRCRRRHPRCVAWCACQLKCGNHLERPADYSVSVSTRLLVRMRAHTRTAQAPSRPASVHPSHGSSPASSDCMPSPAAFQCLSRHFM